MRIENKNIIFLHPAKTGGSSIERALAYNFLVDYKFGDWKQADRKHLLGMDALLFRQQKIDPSITYNGGIYLQHIDLKGLSLLEIDYKRYSTCTSVRNPYTRLCSCFFYNAKDRVFDSFEDFVFNGLEKIVQSSIQNKTALNHFAPQYMYCEDSDGYTVNNVVRQENLNADVKALWGINVTERIAETSRGRGNYMDMYSAKTKDVVYQLYKEDFRLLGYKK